MLCSQQTMQSSSFRIATTEHPASFSKVQNPSVSTNKNKKADYYRYLSANIWTSVSNCMPYVLIKLLPGALPKQIISLSKSYIYTAVLSYSAHPKAASGGAILVL